MIHGKKKPLKM